MEIEIGRGKKARRAYGFDEIAIVPSRRTRNPDEVDVSWKLGPYRFALPLVASPMDPFVPNWGRIAPLGVAATSVLFGWVASLWQLRPANRLMRLLGLALGIFLAAAFYHAALGLQVIIEDYVHCEGRKVALLLLNKLGFLFLGIVAIYAIVRINFGLNLG